MGDRTDEILVHLDYLRKGQDETIDHLRTLNGRLGRAETDVAVLKDRAGEAKRAGVISGATAGTFMGGVFIALYQYFGGK